MKRIFNTLILFALTCVASLAGNELTIPDFSAIPGEEQQIGIHLSNTDPISSLQFDVAFPKGIDYVEGSLAWVTSRISRSSHQILAKDFGNRKYRFGALSTSATIATSAIKGSEGAILTIKVKVPKDFDSPSKLIIDNVIGSNGTVKNPIRIDMPNQETKVGVNFGQVVLEANEVVLSDKPALVNVTLDNTVALSALQADITLSKGVSFADGLDGEWVTYSTVFQAIPWQLSTQPQSRVIMFTAW